MQPSEESESVSTQKPVYYLKTGSEFEGTMEQRLRDKFRGCLVGALVGDCIGTLFECDYSVSYSVLGDLYLSLTNLSEDEKLMDLHGIDFSLGPKVAQEMLERKHLGHRSSIAVEVEEPEAAPQKPPKRHSSFERRRGSFSRPIEKFSDDTVMTRSVIRSLIRTKGFDVKNMAKQLTEDHFLNLTRKFGAFTREIFTQLKDNGYNDPHGPARKASGSLGSLGNEGATRIAPIALVGWNSDLSVVSDMASKLSKITNYHKSAVTGAVCQALAVHIAFNWDISRESRESVPSSSTSRLFKRPGPSPELSRKLLRSQENIPLENKSCMEFNYKEFCRRIEEELSHLDKRTSILENLRIFMSHNRDSKIGESIYSDKIRTIIEFMERPESPPRAEVVERLGNGVKASESVPAALYSFIMAASSVQFPELPVHIKSPVLRSIFYAISLGGDSDTIASMTGAIAGAYWGYGKIPQEIFRVCEGSHEILKLADALFNQFH